VAHATCRDWYNGFREGDFNFKDRERPGQAQKFEDAELRHPLDQNFLQTEKELAVQLGVTQQTVFVRLHKLKRILLFLRKHEINSHTCIHLYILSTNGRAKRKELNALKSAIFKAEVPKRTSFFRKR